MTNLIHIIITLQDNGNRAYEVGGMKISFHKYVVNKFIEWNAYPNSLNTSIDKRFIHALMYTCVGKGNLNKEIPPEIKSFIKGMRIEFS